MTKIEICQPKRVTFNIHVDYMSIGFLVADLVMLVIEISCFRKIKQIVICKPKIVLNTPCQFFAHTLATVMLNMPVNFMSIGFLVADLVMLVIEIDFVFSKKTDRYNIYYIQYIAFQFLNELS